MPTSVPSGSSGPSPALTHRSPLTTTGAVRPPLSSTVSAVEVSAANLDLTLSTAITHLVQHLIQPLSAHYSHPVLISLRDELSQRLTSIFEPTWETPRPTLGSGSRSLICSKYIGLPVILRDAAKKVGVDQTKWRKAIAGLKTGERGEEWETWCDPGQVVWRWGGWEWEDVGFEPFKVIKEPFQIIWQASSASPSLSPQTPNAAPIHTPARPSHAIPIRAPSAPGPLTPGPTGQPPIVSAIPPTPAPAPPTPFEEKVDLLPAFANLGLGHAPGHQGRQSTVPSGWTTSDASSRSASMAESYIGESRSVSGSSFLTDQEHDHDHSDHETDDAVRSRAASRGSHRGSESTSSVASSVSDSNSGHTQLLTPASRPGSADPFGGIPSLSLKDKRDDLMRKITPPGQSSTRGRTPSPNPTSTPDGSVLTPATENTATPGHTPTVTPYDGGNVTVLGGGVKLGGASRPSSVLSSRSPIDRSRSPSVSHASRALNSAVGPNSNGGGEGSGSSGAPRKQRTRRRIMPTYLGHLGQPGVGGPITGVFGQFSTPGSVGTGSKTGSSASATASAFAHVGVGVSPPAVGRGVPVPMPRMG